MADDEPTGADETKDAGQADSSGETAPETPATDAAKTE